MGPRLILWYFCQLVIKYAIRRDTPCSKADTLLRLRGARSRFRTGGILFANNNIYLRMHWCITFYKYLFIDMLNSKVAMGL